MTTTTVDDVWVRRYRPAAGAKTSLVCFPHAGGSASFFAPVARSLPPAVEVLALQYPGRQDRRHEPTIESIPELADRLFEVLRGLPGSDGRRLAFFGHSMGATVAFEVIRRFEGECGVSPAMFWASARRAPSIPPDGRAVHRMDDEGLIAELRRVSGTDSALFADDELLRSLLPAIRGDYKAVETYACPAGAGVACPITVFAGDADPLTSADQVSAWRGHTTGDFAMRVFPGGHFYLTARTAEVVRAIRERLESDA